MGLINNYVQNHGKISTFFEQIRDAQAPDQFTQQLLKDWGYTSTNDRAFIPLLKGLGFLSAEGSPTQRYLDYRNHSKSAQILGEAIKESYSDIFLIKATPTTSDNAAICGKFKSFFNASDTTAQRQTNTFFGLLEIADITGGGGQKVEPIVDTADTTNNEVPTEKSDNNGQTGKSAPLVNGLHYNIQIHLPATKDIEVYNSIFKSLKEHLIE